MPPRRGAGGTYLPNDAAGRNDPLGARFAASERRGDGEQMTDIRIGAVAGGSTDLRGYLAVPSGDGPWPGVVVVHEAFGVVDVMRRQADRLAAAGYLTLIPNLYSDGGAARCVLRTMRTMFSGRGPAI